MINPLAFAGRGLLASVFITGGLNQLKAPEAVAPVADQAKEALHLDAVPLGGKELVTLNGAGMVAAGATLALGILPRTSALALLGLLAPTTYFGHPYWKQTDPGKRFADRNGFYSNAAILGGLLTVVARG